MLDDDFRRRVAAVAESDPLVLDDAAQARVLKAVRERGPSEVQRSRRRRTATIVAGPVLAAAAAYALWASVGLDSTHPSARGGAPAGRVCDGWTVPASAERGFVTAQSASRLDLGRVALAVADDGAKITVAEAGPCRTVLALGSGRVVIHAKNLGGGELIVQSGHVDVEVRGTVFAVTRTERDVKVEVVEGRVAVSEGKTEHEVTGGARLLVSDVGVASGRLSKDEAKTLEARLGGPEIVGIDSLAPAEPESAEPSDKAARGVSPSTPGAAGQETVIATDEAPGQMLARAEALRRSGDHAGARELYRRVGAGSGVTAEAAWLALARMELANGNTAGALEATSSRRARFGHGTLGPEALWIEVRTHRAAGDSGRAKRLAGELVSRWPKSAQAGAARLWLEESGSQ